MQLRKRFKCYSCNWPLYASNYMEVTLMAFLGWGFVITPIIMILSTASPVGLVAELVLGFFVFSASEAYLIENGKVTRPVKGATLIGNGPEVLKHVSMLGNDLQLDPGVGTCGKEGQSVPVGVGQPTMLIDKLTVGGTSS